MARTTVEPAGEPRVSAQHVASAPALACLDGLAGESVEAACERAVFGSADTAAAAVSYTATQVSRVIASGSARTLSPEQQVLKRTVERDRYGLVAQVIAVRDRCIITDCPLFRVLSDSSQIKSNMSERHYDALVARYSPSWTSAAAASQALPASTAASMLTGVPSGKPTNIDFANSAAIPPVNIMTSEPPAQPAAAAPAAKQPAAAAPASKQPAAAPTPKSANAQAQAKRPSVIPPATSGQASAPAASIGRPRVVAPVPYVPSQVGDEN